MFVTLKNAYQANLHKKGMKCKFLRKKFAKVERLGGLWVLVGSSREENGRTNKNS